MILEVLTYSCPNCGAPLEFNSETQRWDCKFCLSAHTLETLQGMENSSDTQAAEPQKHTEESTAEQCTSYSCPNCGAEMITEANTAASFCAFCGSPAIFPKQLSGQFHPEKLIPFRFSREEAIAALQALCKKRPLLPKDFSDQHHIEKITGIYVPFWLFDCKMDVEMNAAAQRIQTWSDSRYRYTKTDHYRLERQGKMEVIGVPADGLQRMSDDMMDALEPFDYSTMTDFQLSYLSGYFAERYDVDKEASWPRVHERINQAAKHLADQSVHGYVSHQTTHFMTRDYDKKTQYAMLPVWLLSTNYKGKNYLLAMNGQTGKMVGQLPMSWGQLGKWFAISGGLTFLITLIGGLLL